MSSLKQLSFSVEEYHRRLHAIQAAMKPLGLDALLVHDFPSICYITGVESIAPHKYWMTVVPQEGDPLLLSQDFEVHNTLVGAWMEEVATYGLREDPVKATSRLLIERGLADKRLGVAPDALKVSDYHHLTGMLPDAMFSDATGLVEQVKVIKSAAEIEMLRRAAHLSSAGMLAATEVAKEGKSDNDVAAAAYQAIISGGSEYMCYAPIVTVGGRSGIPHTTHRRVRIKRGDTVFMEFGACLHRYSAPIMRTAVVGEPPDEIRYAAEACRTAVESLIDNMKPGLTATEVNAIARKSWLPVPSDRVWYGAYAYSIGIGFPPEWNDCPLIVWDGEETVLKPGMTFHATCSLRAVGRYGTTVGETVVVTEDGCEVLTHVPRDLVVK